MNMKKALMAAALLCALVNFAFAGGGWATGERVVYDGESEVVFTYSGLEGVSARVYQNGTFVGGINTGTAQRRIVTDGSHTFEVRPGVYDSATKQTVEDTTASKTLTVSSLKNRSSVRIVIVKSGDRNVVSEFSLTNAVAIQTQPKPPETPAAQPANKPEPAKPQSPSAPARQIIDLTGQNEFGIVMEMNKTYRLKFYSGDALECIVEAPRAYRSVVITTEGDFDTVLGLSSMIGDIASRPQMAAQLGWHVNGSGVDDISTTNRNARFTFNSVPAGGKLMFRVSEKNDRAGTFILTIQGNQ
jgi:hypothetical protein